LIAVCVNPLTLNCSTITLTTTTSGRNAIVQNGYLPYQSTLNGLSSYTTGPVCISDCTITN
jgi:hypothetical protein